MPRVSRRRFSSSVVPTLGGLARSSGAALGGFRLFGQEKRPIKPIMPSRPLRRGFQARGDVRPGLFLV
jgi:hypothetical protein